MPGSGWFGCCRSCLAHPARQFYEIARSLPENEAVLKRAPNNYLEVRSGSALRLVGLPATRR